jgi:hypothetical protein
MSMEYALQVLKGQRRTIQEKLHELSEHDRFESTSVKRLITQLEHNRGDLDFAIEYIEDYNVE